MDVAILSRREQKSQKKSIFIVYNLLKFKDSSIKE